MAGRRRSKDDELSIEHLRRLQRGARAALALGIGASLAANVLAADPSLIGKLIAAWSPIALLVTVELLFRIPTTSGPRSYLRIAAAVPIALIAAWVSYHHMVEVAEAYGETRSAALLLPFSVDGLVIVASVSLAEIAHRLQVAEASSSTSIGRRSQAPPPKVRKQADQPKSAPTPKPSTTDVGAEVRRLLAEHPEWTRAQVAEAAGCSVRTVRRHAATSSADDAGEGEPTPAPVPEPTLASTNGARD